MADIDTSQLNEDSDSPVLARASLLESVRRVNSLTQLLTLPTSTEPLIATRSLVVEGQLQAESFLGSGQGLIDLQAASIVGIIDPSKLGNGDRDGSKFLRDDGVWTAPPSGGGGSSGPSVAYDNISRYQANKTTGFGVTICSSSKIKQGVSWVRNGTQLTITDPDHGRGVGRRAIIRNANIDQQEALITAVTTNTFTIDTIDGGGMSGSNAAYSMGFTWRQVGATGAITGGVVEPPPDWDAVLISVRIHLAANSRAGTTYALTVPKGYTNGVGGHTSMDDLTLPMFSVRNDAISMAVVAATIGVTADYGTFNLANLSAVAGGLVIGFVF